MMPNGFRDRWLALVWLFITQMMQGRFFPDELSEFMVVVAKCKSEPILDASVLANALKDFCSKVGMSEPQWDAVERLIGFGLLSTRLRDDLPPTIAEIRSAELMVKEAIWRMTKQEEKMQTKQEEKMQLMSNYVVDLHIKGSCLRFMMREKQNGLVALREAVDILTHAGFDVYEGSYRLARPQDNYRELTPELAELAKKGM